MDDTKRSGADRQAVAIAIGDPAGIGPEIALKAARDPRVVAACHPVLIGDLSVLAAHAVVAGIEMGNLDIHPVVLPDLDGIAFGEATAAGGRAAIAFAAAAIDLAQRNKVDAVVAAPHTQNAINKAGIAFDGYPGFVAHATGVDRDRVFLMLIVDRFRIAHVTLHLGLRAAIQLIDQPRIEAAIAAVDSGLRALGIDRPTIAVSGINPHAGDGGLMGWEEMDTIAPAIERMNAAGFDVWGPFGADTMLLKDGFDAFLVMYHDQGHVPAKLIGFDQITAMPLGVPIRFASVGHGSAYDIAGRGVADPAALIKTILRVVGAEAI